MMMTITEAVAGDITRNTGNATVVMTAATTEDITTMIADREEWWCISNALYIMRRRPLRRLWCTIPAGRV